MPAAISLKSKGCNPIAATAGVLIVGLWFVCRINVASGILQRPYPKLLQLFESHWVYLIYGMRIQPALSSEDISSLLNVQSMANSYRNPCTASPEQVMF